MTPESRGLLARVLGLVGAVALFALTVYPFQYGLVESSLLVCLLLAAALFETVLSDTSF